MKVEISSSILKEKLHVNIDFCSFEGEEMFLNFKLFKFKWNLAVIKAFFIAKKLD